VKINKFLAKKENFSSEEIILIEEYEKQIFDAELDE
jgi:hypothetical protein